jgi:hypothetical protein
MTKLVWDKIDEKFYETGIDRGVLYIPNPQGEYWNGFAWNGLTSVDEKFDQDNTEPYYFDGVKYLDTYNLGDYAATLQAFTYPDEFLEFEGIWNLGNGLLVDDQRPKVFALSYRTLIGDEINGISKDYQIHLLYNLTAEPSDSNYQNGSESSQPLMFSWEIDSVPERIMNFNNTAHIIIDSRYIKQEILQTIEDIIYGTEDELPHLPSLGTILNMVLLWDAKLIEPDTESGLASLVAGLGDLTEIHTPGFYYALPTTRLVASSIPGLYSLEV